METSFIVFISVVLFLFIALDIFMIVSLIRPGDERGQMIVWKASAYTLLASVGGIFLDVIENLIRGQEMHLNPFVHLEIIAIIYFIAVLVFRKRLSS